METRKRKFWKLDIKDGPDGKTYMTMLKLTQNYQVWGKINLVVFEIT